MKQDSKKTWKKKLLWATSIFHKVKLQAMFWYSFMDMTESYHDTSHFLEVAATYAVVQTTDLKTKKSCE